MKRMALILVIFALGSLLSAVNWHVSLDSMESGDWWDATLTVYVNGVPVLNNITYNGGWDDRYFNVENGDRITTLYTPAEMFDYENIYSIWNHLDELVTISGVGYTPPQSIITPIIVSIPTAIPSPAYNPSPATASPDRGIAGTLSWNFGTGTENYQLWFGTPGNMNMVSSGRTTTSTGSYSYSGLQPLTEYNWQIKSLNYLSSVPTESPVWSFSTEVPAVADYPYTTGFEMEYILPADWVSISGSGNWFPNNYAGGYGWSGGSVRARFCNITGTVPFHLITPPLNMSNMDGIDLIFDYAYATYLNRVDKLEIFVSSDYGATYVLHYTMLGGSSGELNTAGSQSTDFIPTIGQWRTKTISIPLGTNKIRFTATSANGNNLYLDNIVLQQGPVDTVFNHDPASLTFTDLSIGETGTIVFDHYTGSGYNRYNWIDIYNSGTQSLILPRENVYLTGVDADQFWFDPSYLPRTITAGGGFGISVRFTPTSAGDKHATLHLVYHGEDHTTELYGYCHAAPQELWQRFETADFPPDMWSQTGGFAVDPSMGIFSYLSPYIITNTTIPEQMLMTPVLQLNGAINTLAFYSAGVNNTLGYGSSTLQIKYQLYGTNTWTNLGSPILYNLDESIRRHEYDLSGLPIGLYRFGFAVRSTFAYQDYVSAIFIDDVSGPGIYHDGTLDTPSVQMGVGRALSWNSIINANHYQIYGSDLPDGTFSLLETTANNSWQDPNSSVNKQFYKVNAISSNLRSDSPSYISKYTGLKELLALPGSNLPFLKK